MIKMTLDTDHANDLADGLSTHTLKTFPSHGWLKFWSNGEPLCYSKWTWDAIVSALLDHANYE